MLSCCFFSLLYLSCCFIRYSFSVLFFFFFFFQAEDGIRDHCVTGVQTCALPIFSVTHFFLSPEGVLDFNDGVKKASAAMAKAMPNNPSNWYSLANGGPGPEVVLVRDLKSISELRGVPGKTVDQIVQEAYGDQGAAVMVAIRKAYNRSYSELLHFRPDLTYLP